MAFRYFARSATYCTKGGSNHNERESEREREREIMLAPHIGVEIALGDKNKKLERLTVL